MSIGNTSLNGGFSSRMKFSPLSVLSWEPNGTPPNAPPQEIAGLIKGLLTIGFP